MRNIFWLASYFFKIKNSNRHCLGNQSRIAGFPIFILNSLSAKSVLAGEKLVATYSIST